MMRSTITGALTTLVLAATALHAQRYARPVEMTELRPRTVGDRLDGAVSPDGRTYAYLEVDHGQSRLWVLDLASKRRQLLTPRTSHWGIAWSPDSKRIAVASSARSDSAPSGIWVVGANGGNLQL